MGLPPAVFLVHVQLSFIYAGWTHNETVPKLSKVIPGLGHVFEFIFHTPSHHRVHHGASLHGLAGLFCLLRRPNGAREGEPFMPNVESR